MSRSIVDDIMEAATKEALEEVAISIHKRYTDMYCALRKVQLSKQLYDAQIVASQTLSAVVAIENPNDLTGAVLDAQ